jgi:hypothetical protein
METVLFCCTFSNLNREFFSDTCWSLSMYLEAVAMLPQIFMFQKQAADEGGTVDVSIFQLYSLFHHVVFFNFSSVSSVWSVLSFFLSFLFLFSSLLLIDLLFLGFNGPYSICFEFCKNL